MQKQKIFDLNNDEYNIIFFCFYEMKCTLRIIKELGCDILLFHLYRAPHSSEQINFENTKASEDSFWL